jgi:hypothetical protein
LDDLFALISREAIVDICQLSRRFQSTTGREWLTRPVSFDPSVWVGNIGASPDVLLGDCLLDLKTSVHPRLERVWLDQLLLYTLVVGDRKKINRLGFHLLRQDRTITWPIATSGLRMLVTELVRQKSTAPAPRANPHTCK